MVLKSDGTLDLRPKKAELEWAHRSDVPCGRHLVPPFVNYLSLDWTMLRGMVKCRSFAADAPHKRGSAGMHSDMKFRFGGALGMTHASLLSCGNTLVWKSTSVRALLATVQGYDVAHL